ncbi:Ruda putative polyprotein [Panicum miliaceum]|uniref:Ruda putative polyprotein n=1 Tax=Panicum miliaceum TaxID=4540 RepID=A0A3L6T7Z7_PANMI|nr:Ruda putative polyprotein [Panicum miliaceum]
MYSCLSVLVNEINFLDVKKIEDTELSRKIFPSLRRPDYDLVTSIIYEKELSTLTPNQVLNKVIADELRNGIKPRDPPSSPTQSALACKQAKMLKKLAIKGSSSEEEEEEASTSSSNDEKEEMHPKPLKQVKIMNKRLKKINVIGFMVFLKDGPYHQLLKVEKIKFKKEKKQKKEEEKHKHEAFATFGEWIGTRSAQPEHHSGREDEHRSRAPGSTRPREEAPEQEQKNKNKVGFTSCETGAPEQSTRSTNNGRLVPHRLTAEHHGGRRVNKRTRELQI